MRIGDLTRGPRWLWGAVGVAVVTGALGLLADLSGHAWLIPSLGPSILMQCYMPRSRESRLFNVVMGQSIGVASGVLAVLIAGSNRFPGELEAGTVQPAHVAASVIGIVLTLLLQVSTNAVHPPAASTALLLATGSFRVASSDQLTMLVGILLVGLLGEPMRRWRARYVAPSPPLS